MTTKTKNEWDKVAKEDKRADKMAKKIFTKNDNRGWEDRFDRAFAGDIDLRSLKEITDQFGEEWRNLPPINKARLFHLWEDDAKSFIRKELAKAKKQVVEELLKSLVELATKGNMRENLLEILYASRQLREEYEERYGLTEGEGGRKGK